jgi:hypothetical protein
MAAEPVAVAAARAVVSFEKLRTWSTKQPIAATPRTIEVMRSV